MNKSELIEHIAKNADITKAQATRALEATLGMIKITLSKGGAVNLMGFGTFYIGKRAARMGRNPATGEAIHIKASKKVAFRAAKELKESI